MKYSEGFQPIHNSLSELPHWISDRILQQIKQLTCYEPVIGIMVKPGRERVVCAMPCLPEIYHRSVMWSPCTARPLAI